MVIQLERDMTLQEIMNVHGREIVRECKGDLEVYGMHYNSDKYLLVYYSYISYCVLVVPIKWQSVKDYREHYDIKLFGLKEFEDIDFTLDILEDMNLVPSEADEMFKVYEERFLEEEKYELLQYLNNKRNEF